MRQPQPVKLDVGVPVNNEAKNPNRECVRLAQNTSTLFQDTFGGLFGSQGSGKKARDTSTQKGQSEGQTRTMQGGGSLTGFWAPPPVMGFRSQGICKNAQSYEAMLRMTHLLSFWITAPGTVKTGQVFDIGPYGNYGKIKKVMVWDVNGCVTGAYTEETEKNVRIRNPYTVLVEKWDADVGAWSKIDEYKGRKGQQTFAEQGYYRLTVMVSNAAFPLAPKYKTVIVEDPRYDRKGRIVYTDIDVKLPPPYSGLGMTIDGRNKKKKPIGPYGSLKTDCGTYTLQALARRGKVTGETNASLMATSGKLEPYGRASWIMRDQEGSLLSRSDGAGSFTFDANYYGDGRYTLETHLSESDQGLGIQNFRIKPAKTSIKVYNCGDGDYKPPSPVVQTAKGEEQSKKNQVISSTRAPFTKFSCKENKVVLVQNPPFDWIEKGKPDVPDVPFELSNECDKLRRQIIHRRSQLQIPCDSPVAIMKYLIAAPEEYQKMEQAYAEQYEKANKVIQKINNRFRELEIQYLRLFVIAQKNKLLISVEDQAKYRPQYKPGIPSTMGFGIPLGFFVMSPEKIDLANKLRAEQKKVQEVHRDERVALQKKIPELKKEFEKINQRLKDYYQALVELRENHDKRKTALNVLYNSGKFEHCLGGGGLKTSGDYSVSGEKSPAWGLPGMNIMLPLPDKKILDISKIKIPEALHLKYPGLKIKWDGQEWQKRDRKLVQSLCDAKLLELSAKSGFLNMFGRAFLWLAQPTGLDKFLESSAAGKTLPEAMAEGAKSSAEWFAWLGKGASELVVGSAVDFGKNAGDLIFNKPVYEAMEAIDKAAMDNLEFKVTLPYKINKMTQSLAEAIIKGTGEDLAKTLRSPEVVDQIKNNLEGFYRLGDTGAIGLGMEQLALLNELDEDIDGIQNTILTAATANITMKMASTSAKGAKAALSRLLNLTKKSAAKIAKAGKLIGNHANLKAIADRFKGMKEAGAIAAEHADDALAAIKEADVSYNKLKQLALKQKQITDKIDDTLEKAIQKQEANFQVTPRNKLNTRLEVPDNAIKERIGGGSQATVFEWGDDGAAKVFKGQHALDNFNDAKNGIDIMRNKGIPHIECKGVGKAKGKPTIFKERFIPSEEATLQDIIHGNEKYGLTPRKLTRQEMIDSLDFYHKAAQKGVAFGDANSGNLARTLLDDGTLRMRAVEGGSIADIGDPKKARELMAAMFGAPVDNPETAFKEVSDAFVRILGEEKSNALFNKWWWHGQSLTPDTNIAKHIDPDILEHFKAGADDWDIFVKKFRKEKVLENPKKFLGQDKGELLKAQLKANKALPEQIKKKVDAHQEVMRKVHEGMEMNGVQQLRPAQAQQTRQTLDALQEEGPSGVNLDCIQTDQTSFLTIPRNHIKPFMALKKAA